MSRPRKSNAELRRVAQWQDTVGRYQRKHRTWVMTSMPTMPPEHWKLYERWVAGFGAMCMDQAARNTRKLRRRMRAVRAAVTATVALRGNFQEAAKPPQVIHGLRPHQLLVARHEKMRWAMGGKWEYGTAVSAPVAGAAKKGRATRRK